MNLFYACPDDVKLPVITIRDQEAHHITKVLRNQVGDKLDITDGSGNHYHCIIKEIHKSIVVVSPFEMKSEVRTKPYVTLCIGKIKNRDRMEFAVEKATELGVDCFVIFQGDHSQKGNVRKDRIESTVIAAMKQSLRLFLPEIHIEESLETALEHQKEGDILLMADETTDSAVDNHPSVSSLFLVIGPEGGFSKKEREILKQAGSVEISLGVKRLRTETAAIIMAERYKNFSRF